MESCRRCGAALGPSQRFCTACGAPADAPTPPPEANETVVLPPPGGAW
ncbi:MAG: zinc-ribbon domain-containing protein, partial [Acidimicrobiales bacterium]|nr:zinc-ribbon domain-containing protein [Acidimicrobiales bacterium]